MSGEVNLETLLNNMRPVLNTGDYVFCNISTLDKIDLTKIIGSFKEDEGITIILSKAYADTLGLEYSSIMSWITLQVHSSLEAVGLTAAFSSILAKNKKKLSLINQIFFLPRFFFKKNNSGVNEENFNYF